MKYILLFLVNSLFCFDLMAQEMLTAFERSDGKKTTHYADGIAMYKSLAKRSSNLQIEEKGVTDFGLPLHLVTYQNQAYQGEIHTFLILNAIHPGEPAGAEASLMFIRDVVTGKQTVPDNIRLAIVPFYNIGGMHNRYTAVRFNQDGPEDVGFRGNAKNLDLNRDFIKMDSKNAFAFVEIFQSLDPDLFLDTHTTNGSDFQHVMTLLATQKDKLGYELSNLMQEQMIPDIYKAMEVAGYPPVPYVNAFGTAPQEGFNGFLDLPRYSSGYAALFQTPGIVSEAHSLKTFPERVNASYELIRIMTEWIGNNGTELHKTRLQDRKTIREASSLALNWKQDKSQADTLNFLGFESFELVCDITGMKTIGYDRSKPKTYRTPFYDHFIPTQKRDKPQYYIISKAWDEVVKRLKQNKVEMMELESDSLMSVVAYKIKDYTTAKVPFEGHFKHAEIQLEAYETEVQLYAGDYLIPTDQDNVRYLMEALEPDAPDSFFSWNFFDTILQQKEYFSIYKMIEKLPSILEANPDIKAALERKKKEDEDFEQNAYAQMYFVYERSRAKEKSHLRYPVFFIK
ncbi:MAG: hypothetical protein LAT68_16120 [Cyclobacteriaceae bacterium]|nr:hypothetical protein [Cyclobacteriaceae bacterium]MCH8517844.1 hypothetical protein [Cyclobacteriaceae bacterium]